MTNGELHNLKLEHLRPYERDHRFLTARLKQVTPGFVESIRTHGVLQPILVRPIHADGTAVIDNGHDGESYEVIAGSRRFRAAEKAGLKAIPCHVRRMTDAEAAEAACIENLERTDLHPLEEGLAVAEAIRLRGIRSDVDEYYNTRGIAEIAKQLNRSERWVARRASLADLIPEWRKAIEKDHDTALDGGWTAQAIPIRSLELIARCGPERQAELLKDFCEGPYQKVALFFEPEEFEHHLDMALRNLSGAPFKVGDGKLVPAAGPCSSCPKRTSVAPLLFDEEPARKGAKPMDRCTDPVCWDGKCSALVQIKLAEAEKLNRGKPVVRLTGMGGNGAKGDTPYWQAQEVKKEARGAVAAVHVDGDRVGRMVWVKPPAEPEKAAAAGVDRQERDVQAGRRALVTAIEARIGEIDKGPADYGDLVRDHSLAELLAAWGSPEWPQGFARLDKLKKMEPEKRIRMVRSALLSNVREYVDQQSDADVRRTARWLGLDDKAICAAAVKPKAGKAKAKK